MANPSFNDREFLVLKTKCPCAKGCQGRGPECHANCAKYRDYEMKHDAEVKAAWEQKRAAAM